MLQWLCSKGYVAAGINYTLRNAVNEASVYSQSLEIKESMPVVIAEAEKLGYTIDEMAISGGSAGHCLAMLYAYREAAAGLFSVMAGKELSADMFGTPAYDEAMKDISALLWVDDNTVPSLMAYKMTTKNFTNTIRR